MSSDKFTVDADDLEWFEAKPPTDKKVTKKSMDELDDITVIRFENFNKLMDELREHHADEPERGMLTRFAEKTGISPRYLSHVRNGRKNIGHNTARAMEKAFGYPTGWLDQPYVFIEIEDDEAEFVENVVALYRSLPRSARYALQEFCKAMLLDNKSD
jgi:transcriptional regulator with XRE-family HTH domain